MVLSPQVSMASQYVAGSQQPLNFIKKLCLHLSFKDLLEDFINKYLMKVEALRWVLSEHFFTEDHEFLVNSIDSRNVLLPLTCQV